MSVVFLVSGDAINLTIGTEVQVLHKTHVSYDKVVALLKAGGDNEEEIKTLMDPAKKIKKFGEGKLSVVDGVITYKSETHGDVTIDVDELLIGRIETMADEGFPIGSLVLFFENLMLNPSNHAVQGLYKFLEGNKLPLTDDGCFFAYKKIKQNYMDIYSGKLDNSVGKTVRQLRNQCDDDFRNECSKGLHFASFDYASGFYSRHDEDDRMIVVKVNPKDVVAFPNDYSNSKGRCCEYLVHEEIPNNRMDYLLNDFQGTGTVAEVRDLIDKVRVVISEFFPDNEFKLNDSFGELHKVKRAALIGAVKINFRIDDAVEYKEQNLTIYRLIKFISNEVDLSEGKEDK